MKIWFKLILACIILGGVAFFYGVFDCFKLITKGPVDYVDIATEGYKNGTIVDGEINYVLGCPVEEVSSDKKGNSRKSAYFYLVPIRPGEEGSESEKKSIVLVESRNKDDQKILDKIMEETSDESLEGTGTSFNITGKVTKLDAETEGLLEDWLISSQIFEESERDQIPDYIVPNIITIKNWTITYVVTGVGFVVFALGIVGLIFTLKKRK